MAQADVEMILRALEGNAQEHSRRIALAQEHEKNIAESEARQKQIDLEHERLDQENKHFQASLKAAQALRDVQVLGEKAKIAGQPLGEVKSIPGITEEPEQSSTGLSPFGLTSTPATPSQYVTLHHPILGTFQHLTTQAENEAATARAEALQKPLEEAKERETAASKAADLERFRMQKEMDDRRMQEEYAIRERIAAANNASREKAAAIRKAGDSVDDPIVQQHLTDIGNGNESLETLNKSPIGKGNRLAIEHGLAISGLVAPSQKQLDSVTTFTPVAGMLPKIDEYNQLIKDHPYAVNIPGNDYYRRGAAIRSELELSLPTVARSIATDTGRLPLQMIQMARSGEEPSKNFLTSSPETNFQKAQDFLKTVHASVDARLSNLPPAQRAAIKGRIGLPPLPGSQLPAKQTTDRHLYFDAQGKPVSQ